MRVRCSNSSQGTRVMRVRCSESSSRAWDAGHACPVLQSVNGVLRVPGAIFARAYSVSTRFLRHLADAALVRATRDGRHSQSSGHALPASSKRRCRCVATVRHRVASPPSPRCVATSSTRRDVRGSPRIGTGVSRQPSACGARDWECRSSRVARTSAAPAQWHENTPRNRCKRTRSQRRDP